MSFVLLSLLSSPSFAQLSAGGGTAGVTTAYAVYAVDGSEALLGAVIVVPAGATDAPKGFDGGYEYWYWAGDKTAPYAGMMISGFITVETHLGMMVSGFSKAGTTTLDIPDSASEYAVYPHESFAEEDATLFPTVSLSSKAWTAEVYRAEAALISTGLTSTTESTAEHLGWFSFDGGGQAAWMVSDHDEAYFSAGTSEGILLIEADLPEAGSVKVYPAK